MGECEVEGIDVCPFRPSQKKGQCQNYEAVYQLEGACAYVELLQVSKRYGRFGNYFLSFFVVYCYSSFLLVLFRYFILISLTVASESEAGSKRIILYSTLFSCDPGVKFCQKLNLILDMKNTSAKW